MNRTNIPWTDYTWNPVTGCSATSPGCTNCYARVLTERRGLHWGSPVWHPDRLDRPVKVKKPARVFCGSMTDMGQPAVQPEWRAAIADAMIAAPWHTYIVSTKRPGPWLRELPFACWVLVTIEHQDYMPRMNTLNVWAWPKAVKGVSAEPLLGPLQFNRDWPPPDWIIAGPETGTGARPCNPEWLADLETWSVARGIPFFDKRPGTGRRREWPKVTP